jgi:hydrogenase maturation protease
MILVICYGNPLRCDDRLGWEIASMLKAKNLPQQITIDVRQQLTPEVAASVSAAERIVFVDARANGRPGEMSCTRVLPERELIQRMGHAMTPETILSLSRSVFGKCPDAVVCSVVGSRFELGTTLSPEVQLSLPAFFSLVWELIVGTGKDVANADNIISG